MALIKRGKVYVSQYINSFGLNKNSCYRYDRHVASDPTNVMYSVTQYQTMLTNVVKTPYLPKLLKSNWLSMSANFDGVEGYGKK